MGVITVNTPDGAIQVKIQGDAPTEEEMFKLQSVYPDLDVSTPPPQEIVEEPPKEKEIVEGEVEDATFRYQYGRADDAE